MFKFPFNNFTYTVKLFYSILQADKQQYDPTNKSDCYRHNTWIKLNPCYSRCWKCYYIESPTSPQRGLRTCYLSQTFRDWGEGVNLRFRTCGQKCLLHANINAGTTAGKVDKLQAMTLEISTILHLPFYFHKCLQIANWVQNY